MNALESWTEAVCAELDIDPSAAATRAVLDVTRDVAHQVARPAAPLTAYLLGVAVGRGEPLETAGQLSVAGQRLDELSERALAHLRRDEIGFVFQAFQLMDELTAQENVELPAPVFQQALSRTRTSRNPLS